MSGIFYLPQKEEATTSFQADIKALRAASSRGWVSLNRFSALVGISYPTALSLKNQGLIDVVKVGGIFRVYVEEVERFLREGNLSRRGSALPPKVKGEP